MSTIRRRRTFDATVDEVWALVATSEGLAEWLMENDFEPRVGHRFTLRDRPRPPVWDGEVACEVLEVVLPERLRFTWVGGPVDTVVTFELQALPDGRCALELTHEGFEGWRARLVGGILGSGWRDLLRRRIPAALLARRSG